jgi:type I restriction enzyme S subunit
MSTAPKKMKAEQVETTTDPELPEGWASARLPDVCELNPPKPSADRLPETAPVSFVPMPAVDAELGAITKSETRPFAQVRKGFTAFADGDVIMAKITPCMENGKVAVARGLISGLGFGSTEFHVLRSRGAVLPEYVYNFIRQESYRKSAENEMTGSVGQKRVPREFLENTELPLPPLAEQERLINKLNQVIDETRSTRDRLGRLPTKLKYFRQAVLSAACSGKLTEDWRVNHPAVVPSLRPSAIDSSESAGDNERFIEDLSLPEMWARGCIDQVARVKGGKRLPKGIGLLQEDTGFPYIRAGNLKHGTVEGEILYLAPAVQKKIARYTVAAGDVYITIVGACIGDAGIIPSDLAGANLTENAAKITNLEGIEGNFLALFLRSPQLQNEIETRIHSASQGKLALRRIAGLPVPVPSLDEQCEIVRLVGALFKLADVIERRVAAASLRAERLTQAVLAKAFRGELVPTEAEIARREGREYEPVSVLLERIKAERSKAVEGAETARRKRGARRQKAASGR